jgi:hypothetical protein
MEKSVHRQRVHLARAQLVAHNSGLPAHLHVFAQPLLQLYFE